MPNLETYKALMDWAVSPRYRIRGGFNRAFRAPNLGELYIRRTQVFGGGGATRDWCSQNLVDPGDFQCDAGWPDISPDAADDQTREPLPALDGPDGRCAVLRQPRARRAAAERAWSGVGIPISFGNPNLREEQADTWTIGVAMDILEDWRLTVDWYQIEIENMIALEGCDATYQRCMDIAFNPTGDLNNAACQRIKRNPSTGGGAHGGAIVHERGLADFSGVDLALNWSHQLDNGGGLNLNVSANMPPRGDHAGSMRRPRRDRPRRLQQLAGSSFSARTTTTGCSPRVGYGRGTWNFSVQAPVLAGAEEQRVVRASPDRRCACFIQHSAVLRSLRVGRELSGSPTGTR